MTTITKRRTLRHAFKFIDNPEAVRIRQLNTLLRRLDRGRESTAEELNKINH